MRRVSAATLSGSLAATAALGLASGAESADAAGPFDAALIQNIMPAGDGDPKGLVNVNGTLFFAADDGTNGRELWRSDGTTAGTTMIDDDAVPDGGINPGAGDSDPRYLTDVNGTLFFSADDGGSDGRELWKHDPGTGATELVEDINGSTGSYPLHLANVNGTLFFSARDGADDGTTHGRELWTSTPPDFDDGSTYLVDNINDGGDSNPMDLTQVGGKLFFHANDGMIGDELWRHTPGGAPEDLDINSGPGTSAPRELTDVDGTLLFRANDGTDGFELWKSEVTGSPSEVENIFPNPGSSYPEVITASQGNAFFQALRNGEGFELWKSAPPFDASTTDIVDDIFDGAVGSYPDFLTDVNGTLFFSARSVDASNYELWKSDGTGATQVRDIQPGAPGSSPYHLTNVNGTLFFSADDGVTGRELWSSDGTTAGTQLVKDINPAAGPASATPKYLTDVNGTLFFNAFDGADNGTTAHGRELWSAFTVPPATGGGPVIVTPSNLFSTAGSQSNPKNGTVKLTFDLPGAGTLTVEQAGAGGSAAAVAAKRKKKKKPRLIKPVSVTVSGAGPVTVTVRPTGAAKKALKRKRGKGKRRHKAKLKVKARATFTPTGGTSNSQVVTVLLKLK